MTLETIVEQDNIIISYNKQLRRYNLYEKLSYTTLDKETKKFVPVRRIIKDNLTKAMLKKELKSLHKSLLWTEIDLTKKTKSKKK